LGIPEALADHEFMSKRAEELSVQDFIYITKLWKENK
jgi:16S rRNA (adenine1518-N6/adenine1519-N6)-dimethyltransferase